MTTSNEQMEEEMREKALADRYQELEDSTEELSATMHDSAHLQTILGRAQAIVVFVAKLIEFEESL